MTNLLNLPYDSNTKVFFVNGDDFQVWEKPNGAKLIHIICIGGGAGGGAGASGGGGTNRGGGGGSAAISRMTAGDEVYIITARQESDDNTSLFNVASELGIAKDHIFFTNGKDKWEEVKKLGINTHYDNSQEQIDKINENTDARVF